MAVPFRIGVMQLTMEPLDEMLESARAMDQAGMDTVWLAEAYPWWRKHQMEARGSTVVSALMARETERLTIGWGIISPFTRHQRGDHGRAARFHLVLAPPRIRLGEPDRVHPGLVHHARRLKHLVERLHRELHHADAKRDRHGALLLGRWGGRGSRL